MKKKVSLTTLLCAGAIISGAGSMKAQQEYSLLGETLERAKIYWGGSPLRMQIPLHQPNERRFMEGMSPVLTQSASWITRYSSYLLGEEDAILQIKTTLESSALSLEASKARLALATQYLAKGDYPRGKYHLEQVTEQFLDRDHLSEWQVKMAYTLLCMGREAQSVEPLLQIPAQANNYWGDVAKIYLAQILISRQDYMGARSLYAALSESSYLANEAYLGQARLSLYQQEYTQTIQDLRPLEGRILTPRQEAERHLLIGNAMYRLGDSARTIHELGQAFDLNPESLSPEDQLVLAAAYMENKKSEEAIQHLLLATRGSHYTASVANLYLARTRRDMGLYSEALASYQIAANPEAPSDIREAAMYEEVLLLRSRSTTPFGQEVSLCETFVNSFPNSIHRPVMERFLTESYYRSQDYQTSLQSIQKISSPSVQIREAQVFILNRLTQEAQSNHQLDEAMRLNREARALQVKSQHYDEALLLYAQLLSQEGKYHEAQHILEGLIKTQTMRAEQRHIASYLLGYSHLHQQQYSGAQRAFTTLLSEKGVEEGLRADALTRLGDSFYMQNGYTQAIKHYQMAYELSPETQVYALYKLSDIEGLKKNYPAQISALERLIKQHPSSAYTPRAMYDKGRALELAGHSQEAIQALRDLVVLYPVVEYGRKGALQLALLYYNLGKSSEAIEIYKQLLAESPNSTEAQQAFEALKSIYIEEGRSSDFLSYANKLGGGYQVNTEEATQISFEAAQRAYQSRSPQALNLLNDYLNRYPATPNALLARYYKADLLQGTRSEEVQELYNEIYPLRKQLSQQQYATLLHRMSQAAEQHKDFSTSLNLQEELLTLPLEDDQQRQVYLAASQTALKAQNYTWIIKQILPLIQTAQGWPQEEYDLLSVRLGEAYLATNHSSEALNLLNPITQRLSSSAGTQAALLIAQEQIAHKEQMKRTKQLLDTLVDEGYPDPELSARTIITLSDWYLAQGDRDTARLYLKSLLETYSDLDSDLRARIQSKLDKLAR